MRVLLFLLLFIPVIGQSQYTIQDNPNTKRQFRGFIEALEGFRFPIQGGHSIPAGDSLWFVRVNPNDGQLYMWNGLSWGCMTCGGTGIVDSNLFVTLSRLRDSLSRVQSTLDDSIMVLRGLIAGGSADSAILATLYRLDTTRAGLDMRIALKQNQLNGTGFVKASGTTISYDNSTYTPTGRTITINGIAQDLSANRTWTIPVVDTTSLSNRIDGKLSTTDTATMLGGYLRKGDTASLSNRINAKQNAITLTTTGTSGAATFNQSTGALNIPNYANTTYTGSTSIILTSGSFQRAALTGDVTATQNSNSTTIANSAVTNAKMANMATQTFKGRNTAGSGAPEDINMTTARTMLSINNVDNTSDLNKPISTATQAALDLKVDSIRTSVDSIFVKYNGTWLFAGVISAQGAGVSWGSIGGTLSAQTDLQNVLNAKLNISDSTIYFSASRALDSLADHWSAIEGKLSSSDGRIANWTTAYNDKVNSAAFSGTTTKTLTLTQQDGGTVTASFTDDNTTYTGSTSISLTGGSFQRAALTGDVTASANSNATTIANNAVTNAKAADMAVNTIKGRITAGTGDPQDLTASQVRTILNVADGAEVNVNADWDAVSGDAMILNKPTIPDISGLATQQALDDSMDIVRDSINALRADIGGGGGGGVDTTSLSNRIDTKVTKGGDSGALSLGSTTNNNVTILQNNAAALTLSSGNEMTFANSSQFNIAYASGRVIYNAPTRIEYRANNDNSNQMAFNGNLGIGMPNNTSAGAKLEVNGTAGGSSVIGLFRDSVSGDTLFQINNNKTIRAKGLAGTGTRMVMASPTGVFSTADTTGLWLGAGTVVTNWSGASTGLNAATGRTSLGGTTVGQSIFTLANPSAISFIRINANNTVSALSASDFRTAIGAGTGNGTVTSVGLSVPTGFSVSGSPVTTSGTITLSYAAGYQGYTSAEASKLSGIEAGADVTDATNVAAAGAIMDGDFSTNGLMVRTASGSYTSRTLTGTANQITVTNGNGVSGNPTLSLHSDVTDALDKAATALQPEDTVDVLFTKNDARIIRRYVDNCTSCTLTVNDHRTILRISNSSPVTLYVPTGLQDDFEVLIEQAGAGKITITGLTGVAIGSFESAFTTKGTYATATLYATEEEDEYTLTGNLE